MKRAALISVSDRTNLDSICRALKQSGLELLATSGSKKFLAEKGIDALSIEEYTGQKEILDGRVKTLHPKIHAGLLAKRSSPEHMKQLEEEGIMPIDVAVVNLYPFEQGLQSDSAADPKKMVELIDIGGPTMIRAAAKNFSGVVPLIDPMDYPEVISALAAKTPSQSALEAVPEELRRKLSVKVFSWLANYNLEIAKYFSKGAESEDGFKIVDGLVLKKVQSLRYGENPHQKGAYFKEPSKKSETWKQFQGKELSYNNFLDFDAAVKVLRTFKNSKPTVAILKHLNPCGVATSENLLDALVNAKKSDPRSHFGGILGFNLPVNDEMAMAVAEDFAEIVVAPGYSEKALEVFAKKKNLRVIQVDLEAPPSREIRSVMDGILIQQADTQISPVTEAKIVSEKKPSKEMIDNLQFAWNVCAHVKSNAITIAKDQMLLACGAGQMSRIDSVETALMKCATHNHDTKGAVAASDAFFPFFDCLEILAAKGISGVIAPSGAKRDNEVIDCANKLGLVLLFTGDRHFKH
jgi:phosphoribosylaminoimidazolecarboxamide formyltransferase/IMP cyclohydrolase